MPSSASAAGAQYVTFSTMNIQEMEPKGSLYAMTLSANPVDKVTEQPVNGALLDRTMFMGRLLVSSREAQWTAALQKA